MSLLNRSQISLEELAEFNQHIVILKVSYVLEIEVTSIKVAFAEASVPVQIVTHHAPPLGACHVAALVEVAVGTYHTAGVPVTVIPPILVESHAVRPVAVPVAFVATRADGVPRAGVTNVGLFALAIPPVPVEVAPPRVSTIAATVVSSNTVLAAAVIVAV